MAVMPNGSWQAGCAWIRSSWQSQAYGFKSISHPNQGRWQLPPDLSSACSQTALAPTTRAYRLPRLTLHMSACRRPTMALRGPLRVCFYIERSCRSSSISALPSMQQALRQKKWNKSITMTESARITLDPPRVYTGVCRTDTDDSVKQDMMPRRRKATAESRALPRTGTVPHSERPSLGSETIYPLNRLEDGWPSRGKSGPRVASSLRPGNRPALLSTL